MEQVHPTHNSVTPNNKKLLTWLRSNAKLGISWANVFLIKGTSREKCVNPHDVSSMAHIIR